jgi:hypothetical protein
MTREERENAIRCLKMWIEREPQLQTYRTCLEALEQEPCEDAISKQAVLDGLASIAKAKAKSDAQKSLMGRVMFFAEHLPPVTPKQTDALDKIRAEIDQKQYDFMADKDYDDGIRFGLMLAYQIIDKYKAESDDKK